MTFKNITLYSWTDVENVLFLAQQQARWPAGLVWARAYWDGLTLGIKPKTKEEVLTWLEDEFKIKINIQQSVILLESLVNQPRVFNIYFEETDEANEMAESVGQIKFRPTLNQPNTLYSVKPSQELPLLPDHVPPLVGFHSFQGGVGRTLHALTLALAVTMKSNSPRVLLVDADLEAPGLTSLFFSKLPDPSISLADVLALIHGSTTRDFNKTIQLVASRMKENLFNGIYFLPSFRSLSVSSALIRPEHLIIGNDPFLLTKALTELGKLLNVSVVIVDLRNGFSELSASLLLDPRIYRVIVTTPGGQSVDGTCQVLKLLKQISPLGKLKHPLPVVLISQILTKEFSSFPNVNLAEIEKKLQQTMFALDLNPTEILPVIKTDFLRELFIFPNNIDEVVCRIKKSKLIQQIKQLTERISILSC